MVSVRCSALFCLYKKASEFFKMLRKAQLFDNNHYPIFPPPCRRGFFRSEKSVVRHMNEGHADGEFSPKHAGTVGAHGGYDRFGEKLSGSGIE